MKIIISILCIVIALDLQIAANSRKPAGVASLMNFVYVLENYRDSNNGLLPASWTEFNKNIDPKCKPIIEDAVEFVDLRNRYIFFTPPLEFEISGKKEKFIMMATDPELEGVINAGLDSASPGRYLIVEHESGRLGLRRYNEIGLKRIFREKGLELSDYTKKRKFHPIGNKPGKAVPELRQERRPPRVVDETKSGSRSPVKTKETITEQNKTTSANSMFKYVVIVLIVIMGCAGLRFYLGKK